MKILIDEQWKDDFLDEALSEGRVRIQVCLWKNLERLEGLYFVRPRRWNLLWNYAREVGWRNVLRKVRSRLAERFRNEKYVSIGAGRVLEAPSSKRLKPGDSVCFLAPAHPRCMERVVLPEALVRPLELPRELQHLETTILFYGLSPEKPAVANWWEPLRGWNPEAGIPLPSRLESLFEEAKTTLSNLAAPDKRLPVGEIAPIKEVAVQNSSQDKKTDSRLSGCLLGYGNYAKTVILPNVKREIRIERIHEVDPTQIPLSRAMKGITLDTAPFLRPEERYRVYFLAGFHHTHAPLAVQALRQGAFAVVEKPLVTSREQLQALTAAVEQNPGRLFTCYQRRYLPFNQMARRDLAVSKGDPIHYHCIVYEVPLPPLHWYRWPSSRSRLLSNGCHWIDHFLFLNDYVAPERFALYRARNGILNVSIELQNGAMFSMLLTDVGSERIGMSDYVELRAGDRTVQMVRGAEYRAESTARVLRKARLNKMSVYNRMYRTIARKIQAGEPGDSLRQIAVLNELLLELEDIFTAK